MKDSITPDYSSFSESFDDLYVQLDDENKYLAVLLRESIPLEAGYGFFDILESIVNKIYYKDHGVYPSATQRFGLAKEYIGKLFGEGKIKVKLITPVPIFDAELGRITKYEGKDKVIYDNPNLADNLIHDIQERYDMLSLKDLTGENIDTNSESELVQMYHGHGIIISYGEKPFYDELYK